eukprot:TRINITY_DN45801_c0_g1_i1.p2 TRINITY_DN45801_c0_g1~~TRINITY_DN45801_c0_g1_i1.p2  ORF type:complete len:176 (-),score=30.54 TRINITY_DN45801_c0_g1_i1:64-591(-)
MVVLGSILLALLATSDGTECFGDQEACLELPIEEEDALHLRQLRVARTSREPSIIGCSGGKKPVSTGCLENACTYKCDEDSPQEVTCQHGMIIHQDACSGGGCSWSCKSVLGCPTVPKLVGCTKMPAAGGPLDADGVGVNHCMWECPMTKSRTVCAEGKEPKQEFCSGGGCSFVC